MAVISIITMSGDLTMWQQVAARACFATDQQQKNSAEQNFHLLTMNPEPQLLITMVQHGSDTLLFVLFSYIAKNASHLNQSMTLLEGLVNIVGGWPLAGYSFQRDGMRVMENYCSRTIMLALGKLMKELYASEATQTNLTNWLALLPGDYFKLCLLKQFIDAVEVVDTQMGYLRYRTMVYAFQDNIIPLICDILMPYFYAMQEGVRISELSQMQAQLNVTDAQMPPVSSSKVDISSQLQRQIEYVLMLLGRILEFNYNITYTEYQSQTVIDTCLITFPDKVMSKILNADFLNAVFFLIDKVGEIKEGQAKKVHLKRGLELLSKLMQARLSYVNEQVKQKYLLHAVRGLTHLLNRCRQYQDEQILCDLLFCNKKLFINTELAIIKKIINKDQVYCNSQLYAIYVQDLTKLIVQVISHKPVHLDNSLLSEALELANKLLISYGQPTPETEDQESTLWKSFVKDLINAYLPKLCQSPCLLPSRKISSVSETKTLLTGLFEDFKKVASYDYSHFFTQISQGLRYVVDQSQMGGMANLLMLMCELIDRHYLQRNPFLSSAKDSDVSMLAVIVNGFTSAMQSYRQRTSVYPCKDEQYVLLGICLFSEAIINQFLTDYDSSGPFQIKKKLYVMMILGSSDVQNSDLLLHQSAQTVLLYVRLLMNLFGSVGMELNIHILDVIQRCIFKLKWNMKRQSFIKSQFFNFFNEQFSGNVLRSQQLPRQLRTRVAKIISTLTFDDILDEYKFRIGRYISSLQGQECLVVMYELLGVLSGLDSSAVSRFFFRKLQQLIHLRDLMSRTVKAVLEINQDDVYRDLCEFCRLAILNRGLKINNNPTNYEVAGWALPPLSAVLDFMAQNPDLDLWEEALKEIVECVVGMINCSHIGIFTLDNNYPDRPFRAVLNKTLKVLLQSISSVQHYPKLQEYLLQIVASINKEILDYVYWLPDGQSPALFHRLMASIHDLTLEYMGQFQGGNKTVEDKMLKGLDCVRSYFTFYYSKINLRHKSVLLSHLNVFMQVMERHYSHDHFPIHFVTTVMVCVLDHGSMVVIRAVGKLIFELKRCFPKQVEESFRRLGLMGEMSQVQSLLGKKCEEDFIFGWRDWLSSVRKK